MKLENLLLGVLAFAPATGYDLKKYMDGAGRFMRSNTQMSQVYRSLATMEERGWVIHQVEPRPGATDAKRYRLTDEGATVFLDWLTGPYHPPTRYEDPELGVRLSFVGFMSRDQILALLDTEIEVRSREVALYRGRDRSTELDPALPFDAEMYRAMAAWTHRRGAAAKDAHIAQLTELRDALRDAPEGEPLPALPLDDTQENTR